MPNSCYAHSRDGQPPETWQPLEEHLREVAFRASKFAEQISSADWVWNAGWLHDLGKATNAFQKYLLPTPHATPIPPAIRHDWGKVGKSPVLYRSKGVYDLLRAQRPDFV